MKESWKKLLKNEMKKGYFKELEKFLENEYREKTIFPPYNEIFSLFEKIEFEDIKVVIIGQDPYHGKGQGHGVAFSVKDGVPIPPSLKNIFKEIKSEYPDYEIPKSGNLNSWIEQGVFLLNTVLTVEEGKAFSHSKKGWETFTDRVISIIGSREKRVIFLLWGNPAKKKKILIGKEHIVLEAAHPSPLSASRGFLGCNHFKLVNEFLEENGEKVIKW